jgi:predicted nucleotidyltransferase
VSLDELTARLRGHPAFDGLRLLVLHGSRARGEEHPRSDWDFGMLADDRSDPLAVRAALTEILGTDSVDLVELRGASALLRYRTARDGVLLLEQPAGEFTNFKIEATLYWCDVGPVIRAAQNDVLRALG